ncbi:MAG TPA: FAD-dependent oxidoreductase, partial [Thauera aminoaromatica]|nr:FAD-dependent oxidoreductase [Thauera aminoaromatica]
AHHLGVEPFDPVADVDLAVVGGDHQRSTAGQDLDEVLDHPLDRGQLGGPEGLFSCVISAHGPHEALARDELVLAVHAQLERQLGRRLPAPEWSQVIVEKRATFACRPGVFRPGIRTPLPGLWLAGDYLDSDYPATLESAVRSGVACATAILAEIGHKA